MSHPHRVVIIGGGFGGLAAARALRSTPVEVTLVDRRNHHLFQPLLYQVATGELSPANIASPLRGILRRQKNCRVLMGEVFDFDVPGRRVLLADGSLEYDSLIVAAGTRHSYFGRDDWEPLAPGLKTIEDATEIRKRILFAFEAAEREIDPAKIKEWLTFVIVGGGPTGVELAGALAEIAHYTLKHDFRSIRPSEATILLVEASPVPLSHYPEELARKSQRALETLRVVVRTDSKVTDVADSHVVVQSGERSETIPTRTVLWAAGVTASPLGRKLATGAGAETDRAGRVIVGPDLTLAGHPNLFVIGDLASFTPEGGKPLPGLAPVAMQQGEYVARLIASRLVGVTLPPFRYRDRGSLAVIGRYSAVALLWGRQFSGLLAWFIWLFIHLMAITQFRNRLLVLVQWGWTYFTWDRGARLITGETPPPADRTEETKASRRL
jgi:NADH dehydrogenase